METKEYKKIVEKLNKLKPVFVETWGNRCNPTLFKTKKGLYKYQKESYLSLIEDSINDGTGVFLDFDEWLEDRHVSIRYIDPELPIYILQNGNYFALEKIITQNKKEYKKYIKAIGMEKHQEGNVLNYSDLE